MVDNNIKNTFVNLNEKYEDFFSRNNNNVYMDLSGIAAFQLKENKVDNVYYSGLCTFKNSKDFYSFRKFSDVKRFGTFVWID